MKKKREEKRKAIHKSSVRERKVRPACRMLMRKLCEATVECKNKSAGLRGGEVQPADVKSERPGASKKNIKQFLRTGGVGEGFA